MKNTLRIEVLGANRPLTVKEQNDFRAKLQHYMEPNGIVSMCLEAGNLYVEFNPGIFKPELFKQILTDIGFPLERHIVPVSFHFAV
ncbi:MAG: hypothetical protein L3J66_10155 [Bacteroidales bacterium]|nr:hypothetical protein [Bacteroidales bacterium]